MNTKFFSEAPDCCSRIIKNKASRVSGGIQYIFLDDELQTGSLFLNAFVQKTSLSCVKTENTEFLMQMPCIFVVQQHVSSEHNNEAEPQNSFQEGYRDTRLFCRLQIYFFW